MKTKDFRSLSSETQEDIRRKAVKATISGKTHTETAQLFCVSRETVSRWVKRHKVGGSKALKANRRGRPPSISLAPWQAAQIVRAITDRCPDQLKLPFCLWTREAVSKLIERRYGIGLSIWTIGHYLSRWGFTPQKPLRRAFEQNSEEVRKWIEEEYPAIRRKAKREKALVYWGDEMGLRSDHVTGRTYGRRGHTPIIPGTGQRFGCNMISAITNRGQLNFMVFKQRFKVLVFIEFLRRLSKQSKHKVFLIVDGHPVHRARKVKQWIEKNKKRIRMFFLPGYSPELNPDEMLNQDVKSNSVGKKRAHSQIELISNVRSYLFSRKRQKELVKNYFNEKHVLYAAV